MKIWSKGFLKNVSFLFSLDRSLQVVAVKQLDRNGIGKEFLCDIAELSMLQHENLVNLIGYCADGDQRLLVYELFSGRTLENRLFGKLPFSFFKWYL